MTNTFSLTDKKDVASVTRPEKIQRILELNESLKSDPEKHAVFIERLKELSTQSKLKAG